VNSEVPLKNSDACGGHRLRRASFILAQTRSRTGLMHLLFFFFSLPFLLLFLSLFLPLFAFSLPPGFSLIPISVQSPLHLSRQEEAFLRGYGQIRLLFTLSLIHDLSEECRQVSSFGSRRNTVALGENAQPPLIHVLSIKFMHGLRTVVFYCE